MPREPQTWSPESLTEEEWVGEMDLKLSSDYEFKYRYKAYKDELIKKTIERLIQDEILVDEEPKYNIIGNMNVVEFMESFLAVAGCLANKVKERQAASEREKKERDRKAAEQEARIEAEKKSTREKK
jgi:hypothetical protein